MFRDNSSVYVPVVIALLLSTGCVPHQENALAADHKTVAAPSELNAAPERYHGQVVFVRGFVRLAFEGHVLYESEALSAEFKNRLQAQDPSFDPNEYKKYCLTIANPKFFFDHEGSLNSQTLIIKGKFIKDYLTAGTADVGACPLPTALLVDIPDLRQRYRSLLSQDR